MPLFGRDFFTLKAEFQTAQAVSPGQGQTVDIAGVKVGEITNVELKNGRALVTMKIQPKYAEGKDGRPAIYRNARMLLRPKTGLKDMIIEMTPGTPSAGKVHDGETIPVGQTLPDVNPDEVLAALDGDTRRYLVVLLNGASQGLNQNGGTLGDVFRRFEPTARDSERLTSQLQTRGQNLRRVISNFRKLSDALAGKDTQLSQFVDANNAVFQSFAAQEANIRATLQELPPSLTQTQSTLSKVNTLANTAGPTFQALLPGSSRARAGAAGDPAVLQGSDADPQERDPSLHSHGAADREAASPGDQRPHGPHPGPGPDLQGPQLRAQRAGLQPVGERRGLPVLAGVAPPRARRPLHHGRHARRDPPR